MSTYDLVSEIADRMEARLDSVVADMDAAIVAAVPALGADEAIRAEERASSRANVRRFLSVARRAADPPPSDVPPEALDLARTVVRRGIEIDAIHQGYRMGQQTLWRRWMTTAEEVATTGADLAAVLNVSLDLLFSYVDEVLIRVIAEVEREREQVLGGALARRAETIRLLLDGAPLDVEAAALRLRHDLDRPQTALVLSTDRADHTQGALETAAVSVGQLAGGLRPLTLPAGVTTLWAWLAGDGEPLGRLLVEHLETIDPHVRVAVGPTLPGVTGFRRSHEAALAVQRLLERNPEGGRVATYEELEITALAAQDEQRAAEFVAGTLGPLADDTPTAARLRETLRVYLEEAEHAPRTAARLGAHRNTILQRVARATELLGHRPGERRLAVELALELRRRMGPP